MIDKVNNSILRIPLSSLMLLNIKVIFLFDTKSKFIIVEINIDIQLLPRDNTIRGLKFYLSW